MFWCMWAKSLLHWCKRGLHWCKTGWHWCKTLSGDHLSSWVRTPFAPFADAAFLLTVGSFLLTVDLFYLQLTILAFSLTVGASLLTALAFFTYSWNFFAYSGKVRLIRALRDYRQRSLTVGKKAPTVSKKASPFAPSPNHFGHFFGGSQKGGFQKGGFGGCSPGTKTGTKVCSPKPPFYETALLSPNEPFRGFAKGWFPKGWFRRMFPRNENRNEGTFAKTTLLRNRPFISQ